MNLPTTLSLLQIDQLDPAARAEMNLGLGGKNGAVSRSPYPQTSLAAPTTKPRSFYSSAKPRCSLIKYVASRKSARCNKCTRSLPPSPLFGGEAERGMVDASPLGPAHFAYSHPTHPVVVRLPPHHAKTAIVAWNSHQHNNPLSLSPTLANPFRKDCVGASAVTMQAISLLPPSLSLMQHVTLVLSLVYGHWELLGPMG